MYISQQNPENEFDAVNTELVVGGLEQTIKPLSTVSPFLPDPPRTQATGVWNLDSFTVAFLSFPTREGAIRPLRKQKVKLLCQAQASRRGQQHIYGLSGVETES